ncbi:MAG: HSP20 family protein [Bacteroidetes bacterium]|nr:MAG: HSP20 family protein [Bacteroidota bacterium]
MTLIKTNNGNTPAFRTLLSDFFDGEKFFNDDFFAGSRLPAVNVCENEKDFQVELAAPGLKKEDFKVYIKNDVLHISAEKKEEKEEKEKNYTRREFSYNSFSRSFSMPDNINPDEISARYHDGVLKLTILKKVPSTPKNKEIAVG